MKASPRVFRSRPAAARTAGIAADIGKDRTVVRGAPLAYLLAEAKNSTSLVVEIGCGVGLHPILYATQFPQKAIVAIERTSEKFERFAGRLDHHPKQAQRIAAVHADAIHFLDQNFDDASIDEVWILYPNPESKKVSRRWFQAPFMHRLVELMKPGASLYFATNLADYADQVKALAPHFGFETIRHEHVTNATHPTWTARTHFEKKYYGRGETLFDFEFRLHPKNAVTGNAT